MRRGQGDVAWRKLIMIGVGFLLFLIVLGIILSGKGGSGGIIAGVQNAGAGLLDKLKTGGLS